MRTPWVLYGLVCTITLVSSQMGSAQTPEAARKRLIHDELIPAGLTDPRVIESLLATPRHEFVPRAQRELAYFDMALPIGAEQTISSPLIVGMMTEALDPQPTDRVLEIGTGSGYQAAVLSPLVADVYSIEIVPSLGKRAKRTLERLGYTNIRVKIGDGYLGWPEAAPFDKIIVTCSPENVPEPLQSQLREGGRMIIPVGERYQQTLYRLAKTDGKLVREALQPTLFVPMTGRAESERDVQPDPARPTLINGSFESPSESGAPFDGWYYGRQVERIENKDAPDGKFVAAFTNETPGRSSHILQGLGLDGRKIATIRLSADVRASSLTYGPDHSMRPNIVISFYDRGRRRIGERWLGPWEGNFPWKKVSYRLQVPEAAREAILRVGLFGATGSLWVDNLRLTASPK